MPPKTKESAKQDEDQISSADESLEIAALKIAWEIVKKSYASTMFSDPSHGVDEMLKDLLKARRAILEK